MFRAPKMAPNQGLTRFKVEGLRIEVEGLRSKEEGLRIEVEQFRGKVEGLR